MPSRSLIIPASLTSRVVIPLVVLAGIESLQQLARADDLAPKADERQLRYAMHSAMSERPTIRVGRSDADMVGADHRVLAGGGRLRGEPGRRDGRDRRGRVPHGRLAAPPLRT